MSAPSRCHECLHRPGLRLVTATAKHASKTAHADQGKAEPRVHKRTCGCQCHRVIA